MKKIAVLLLVVAGGIACVPDVASLKTAAFAVSLACLIAGALVMVIGPKARWGILPEVCFTRIVNTAVSTPEAAAKVVSGFLIFLGLVLIAIFKAT